jgi:hypothetical protein
LPKPPAKQNRKEQLAVMERHDHARHCRGTTPRCGQSHRSGAARRVGRRAYQAQHTDGVFNGHLVKRWTHDELLIPGQMVDQSLIAALCSEKCDETEGAEGCYLGAN